MYRYLLLVVLILSGCTYNLWKSDKSKDETSYTTKTILIDGFYINKTRNELLVLSDFGGFYFQIPEELSETLILSRKISFEPKVIEFTVDEEQYVSSTLSLTLLDKEITKDDLLKLKSFGFIENDTSQVEKYWRLNGKRYEIEGDLPFEKLNKKIRAFGEVSEKNTNLGAVGKIIATPASIVIDVAIVVPFITYMQVLTKLDGK